MASQKQVVLITGGNTGLGLEAVKALYKSDTPYEILIGSRDPKKGEDAIKQVKNEITSSNSTLSVVQVDISSDHSISAARDDVETRFGRLDCLVNNAGGNFDNELQERRLSLRETWNKSFDVNVSGTMVITSEFVPLLLKSADPRLLFITSGTSTLAGSERTDTPPLKAINSSPEAGWPKPSVGNPITVYRSTKTGLNMAMHEWHRVLKEDGVKVWAVSPGFLATGLAGIGVERLKKVY